MAFDFPNTPAIGERWPNPAIAGQPQYQWNGTEWTAAAFDPAGYVKRSGDTMTGALSLSGDPTQALHAVPKQYIDAQRQRVSLANGKSFDIQVPADAAALRYSMVIFPSSATDMSVYMQLSLTPGVFLGTGNYIGNGFLNSANSSTVQGVINANYNGILLANTHGNATVQLMSEGLLTVKRANTTLVFNCKSSGISWTGGQACHIFMDTYMNTAQAQLSVLALRILSATGDNWAAGSFINLEWL